MNTRHTIGLDYGTNSVRALLVNAANGAEVAAAVVAGVYRNFSAAQKAMAGLKSKVYKPDAKAHAVCRRLYPLYRTLHDVFGAPSRNGNLYNVMKELIEVRNRIREA